MQLLHIISQQPCYILDNLLYITKIASFSTTNSNFIIKLTIIEHCVHSFSSTSFTISF